MEETIAGTLIFTITAIVGAIVMLNKIEGYEDVEDNTYSQNTYVSDSKKNGFNSYRFDTILSSREKAESLYSPIICRPPEEYGRVYGQSQGSLCTDELYPAGPRNSDGVKRKSEMTIPCDPSVDAKYYAKRPILNPMVYYKLMNELVRYIKDPIPSGVDVKNLIHPQEFSSDYERIMNYIMEKIMYAKNTLPIFKDYSSNDTWKGEQFAFWNVKIFAFSEVDESKLTEQERAIYIRRNMYKGPRKYIVYFTLHNTLRSSSLDLVALLYEIKDKLYIKKIKFGTEDISEVENFEDQVKSADVPQWIYGNTLENSVFNAFGFHDPNYKNNIIIPGGVPEEYENVLSKCDQAFLMKCRTGDNLKGGPAEGQSECSLGSPIYPNYPNKENPSFVN